MTAKCPYFGKCGGCSFQHIDYSMQLENKKKTVFNATKLEPLVFSGPEYDYRNRMDLVFHEKGIGLREKGTWDTVVDIERCAIANEKINLLLSEIRDFFGTEIDAFGLRHHKGTFRYAVVRTPNEDSAISFVLNDNSSRLDSAINLIKDFSEKTSANNILVARVPKNTDVSTSDDYFVVKGSEFIKESYSGRTFFYPIQGFFQNNYEVASQMHDYCNKLLGKYKTKGKHLLDLYGGVGTFGIINSGLFDDVVIAESVEAAIACAKKNIEFNEVANVHALVLDATYLRKLQLQSPLFVITDPPRSGMSPKTINRLNELKPEVILYVSCNPTQLGKDIPKFRDYELKSSALFDMFPQTPHCEAVAELKLKTR